MKSKFSRLSVFGLLSLVCLGILIPAGGWVYMTYQLEKATHRGVYASAEQAMRGLIATNYQDIQKIEIEYAGTNADSGRQPHVWFVVAKVWAGSRADGAPVGNDRHAYDFPGCFFLHTPAGWVFMPEGAFPELVGWWMEVYGLAGEV